MDCLSRFIYEGWQDAFPVSVGNNDADTCLGYRKGCVELRCHATSAGLALSGKDIATHIITPPYLTNHFASRLLRIAVVQAIHSCEQDKHFGSHHLGNEARQLVVVREHLLS